MFGIPLYVHVALPAWIAFSFLFCIPLLVAEPQNAGLSVAFFIIDALLLWEAVLLHEFGHAFAAHLRRADVGKIVLWPIGGWTSIDNLDDAPLSRIVVHFAGPLTHIPHFAMFAVSLALYAASQGWSNPFGGEHAGYTLSVYIFRPMDEFFAYNVLARGMTISLWLFALNMMPCYPLDGSFVFVHALRSRRPLTPGVVAKVVCVVNVLLAVLWLVLGFAVLGNGVDAGVCAGFCGYAAYRLISCRTPCLGWHCGATPFVCSTCKMSFLITCCLLSR